MKKLLFILIILLAAGLTGSKAQITFGTMQTNPFGLTDINPVYTDFSAPAFVDLDGDGDQDLMAGEASGSFHYFQNIGSASTPAFAAMQTNPFGLSTSDSYATPAFADLDDDGDMDMMAGGGDEIFSYFQNTGTAAAPSFTARQTNPFGLTDFGYVSHPSFADLDHDGDMDLMAVLANDTTFLGGFYYFQNTGSATAPAFTNAQHNPFGLPAYKWSSSFSDLDWDGDWDIMAGDFSGSFIYFQNTGSITTPAFAAGQGNAFGLTAVHQQPVLTFTDLDGDGDMDMMAGDYVGSFYYFENTTPCSGLIVFADGDEDSYGDADNSLVLADCVVPSGYVIDNTDCDDDNAAIHPGATEVSNDIDDNCDGIIDDGVCQVPANLSISNITGTSAKLNWDGVTGAGGYKIRYKVSGTSQWTVKNSNGNSKNLNNLSPNTSYTWEVKTFCTINPGFSSDWSAKQHFTTGPLRMGEEDAVTLGAYPNPVYENFTLDLKCSEEVLTDNSGATQSATIFLLNELGQIIYSEKVVTGNDGLKKEITMPSNAASGWYMVRVIMNDQVIEKKLLCQK